MQKKVAKRNKTAGKNGRKAANNNNLGQSFMMSEHPHNAEHSFRSSSHMKSFDCNQSSLNISAVNQKSGGSPRQKQMQE